MIRTHDKGRTYHYFRRRSFPIVRLPGDPGSELFNTVYESALKAKSREDFVALRSHMQKQESRRETTPLAEAIMVWASREPITFLQATMVAERFGVSIEEIMRGRQIADYPTNQALANPKDRESFGKTFGSQFQDGIPPQV